MITLTAEEQAALAKRPMTLTACWAVTDRLGNVGRFTAHDRDITIDKAGHAGVYQATRPIEVGELSSSADLSVDNAEVFVPLDEDGITLGAIRAGMFSGMRYTVFVTDWSAPHNVAIVRQRGIIGNARLVSETIAAIELRGLKQLLQQQIVPLCSRSCRTTLGSSACGVDLGPYTHTGTVTAVTDRRIFAASDIEPSEEPTGWYDRGTVTWLTGDNAGLVMDVKRHTSGGQLELLRPMPFDVTVADTFSVLAGCQRRFVEDCRDKFDNAVNFQGEPHAQDPAAVLAEAPP